MPESSVRIVTLLVLSLTQILKDRSWSLQRHLSPRFQDTPNGFSLNCDSNGLPTAHTSTLTKSELNRKPGHKLGFNTIRILLLLRDLRTLECNIARISSIDKI